MGSWVFPNGSGVKNLSASEGDARDSVSVPGWGRSPGGGHGNPLQHSCLESPMDRGAWWAAIRGVTKNRTRLSTHTHTHIHTAESYFFVFLSASPSRDSSKPRPAWPCTTTNRRLSSAGSRGPRPISPGCFRRGSRCTPL